VIRENMRPIKSDEKKQGYVENLETLYQDGMRKREEVMAAL
jgi:hypothetical protein